MILALILVPSVAAAAAFFIRSDVLRRRLLFFTGVAHAGMSLETWIHQPSAILGGWLAGDDTGRLFLTMTSVLFLASAAYGSAYLAQESDQGRVDFEEGFIFSNAREASFTACLLFFLAAMTLVTLSQHLGLLWVAVEATTLASAPLIYFHRHHRSLEATWKYLLICSVGIALALLGNLFLAVAAQGPGETSSSLLLSDLMHRGGRLHLLWLKGAFVLFLVGYGTKTGLAPFHTWLPDAHSEAPSLVSALLSGSLLNCAFLGILRAHEVCIAAGLAAFGQNLLVVFGLLSMAVAAIFISGQSDYKRMLAYSSVEHMGIMALGVGLGGIGAFGAMFHLINHSLTKAMLFMVAGNLLAVYHSKATSEVRGVLHVMPASGMLWLAGFLAITGSPPFGPFLSEFIILKAALDQGRSFVAIFYLGLLAAILAGMSAIVLRMTQGPSRDGIAASPDRSRAFTIVPAALGLLVLVFGLYIPPFVSRLLHEVARALG